jgi:hypothetical protein
MAEKQSKDAGKREGVMERYIAEIDRFATLLRDKQQEIELLQRAETAAKAIYSDAKDATKEAKEVEHNIVSLLLKFIRPGSIDVMPLFDRMEPPDEKVQGKNSTEWRNEPITSLNLSAIAMRALIDINIVLVGQLQDKVLAGDDWAVGLEGVSDGMAQAIEAKLHAFIEEKSK